MRKKYFMILLAMVLMFVSGCAQGVEKTDENSFNITIYKRELLQDKTGFIIDMGLSHWKSFSVLKSQIYDLPESGNEKFEYENPYSTIQVRETYNEKYYEEFAKYHSDGKFAGLQILPKSDIMHIVRERKKKTIKLLYEDKNFFELLDETTREYHEKFFTDTFTEKFDLSFIRSYFSKTVDLKNYHIAFYYGAENIFPIANIGENSYSSSLQVLTSATIYIRLEEGRYPAW